MSVVILHRGFKYKLINKLLKMKSLEEESKGSTSGEESEYDDGADPTELTKRGSVAAKVMPGVYLSTNLITEKNLTLADIQIDSYTLQIIETMESELIDIV